MGREQNVSFRPRDLVFDCVHEVVLEVAHPNKSDSPFKGVGEYRTDIDWTAAIIRYAKSIPEVSVVRIWPLKVDSRRSPGFVAEVHPFPRASSVDIAGFVRIA